MINEFEMTVKEFLKEAETYNLPRKRFVKYCLDNDILKMTDIVDIRNATITVEAAKKVFRDYQQQEQYDVILFSKGGGKIICNEKISYDQAKMICNSENSKGVSYFAGFAPTGQYPHAKEGKNFIINNGQVINPKGGQ